MQISRDGYHRLSIASTLLWQFWIRWAKKQPVTICGQTSNGNKLCAMLLDEDLAGSYCFREAYTDAGTRSAPRLGEAVALGGVAATPRTNTRRVVLGMPSCAKTCPDSSG